LGVYGESKLAGEQAIAASGVEHLILRTAWVYALHGNNFLLTMLRLGGERDELRVVDDQVGSPTPAWLIAQATAHLLRSPVRLAGVFNVVAAGSTSWCGFADAIFDEACAKGIAARRPRVVPIPSVDYPTPARRPSYSVLDTQRLRDAGFTTPHWRDALATTLAGSQQVPKSL
jgi:dTDP-4-dehydrorhamnose reductase